MGFVRDVAYRLKFTDPTLAGLEVLARPAPVRVFLNLAKLKDSGPEALDELIDGVAPYLESWNLEDAGGAVPLTPDTLRDCDFPMLLAIVFAYMEEVANVSVPLGERSSSGGPSLVASLPMEPLSPSRAS